MDENNILSKRIFFKSKSYSYLFLLPFGISIKTSNVNFPLLVIKTCFSSPVLGFFIFFYSLIKDCFFINRQLKFRRVERLVSLWFWATKIDLTFVNFSFIIFFIKSKMI